MQVQSKITLCKSEYIGQNYCGMTTKHIKNNQNIILFMSTIQTRNKMDDKIHQNQVYFVTNAQLFYSSESNEISPISITAVNIAAADILTKELQFLLMNIANMNSETSTIDC